MSILQKILGPILGPILSPIFWSSGVGPVEPDSLLTDLVAWWALDEESGTRYDAHTGGIHLTDNNTVTFTTGKVGNAAAMERINEEYLSSSDAVLKRATKDFTIALWHYPTETAGSSHMIYSNLEIPVGGYRLYWNDSGEFLTATVYDGTTEGSIVTTATAPIDTWSHIVVTHNASTKTLTVIVDDGTPESNTYTETPVEATTDFSLNLPVVNSQSGYWDECSVYSRVLTAAEITRLFDDELTYADIQTTYWSYASLAAAESSGDAWVDGDQVVIVGGARFFYFDSLSTNGHSGLIHQDPYDDGTGLDSVTLRNAEGPNTDPDSWDANWTDVGTGTKGVDYDYDVSTNSRFRKLNTTGGRALMSYDGDIYSADTERFVIVRDIDIVEATSGTQCLIYAVAYRDGSNRDRIIIGSGDLISTTKWYTNDGTEFVTSKDKDTVATIWLYVTQGKYAVWFDGDAMAEKTGTAAAVGSVMTYATFVAAANESASGTSDVYLSSYLHGGMSTS